MAAFDHLSNQALVGYIEAGEDYAMELAQPTLWGELDRATLRRVQGHTAQLVRAAVARGLR